MNVFAEGAHDRRNTAGFVKILTVLRGGGRGDLGDVGDGAQAVKGVQDPI